jgi:hypothetical protein
MKWCTFYLVLALLLGAVTLVPAQEKKEKKGKLGKFVDDYKKKKKDGDDKQRDDNENQEEDDSGNGWLGLVIDIFFSPGNKNAEESDSLHYPPKPAPYPYHADNGGLPIRSRDYRSYGFMAEAGYLHLSDGVQGLHLAGDLRASRFAANLDLHALVEDVEGEIESLSFLGLNAGYEVIATPNLLLRPYLGARNLSGLGVEYWGPEVGGRLLMLPRKPLNIEANLAHSWINGKPLTILSGSVGLMIKRFELRLGGQMFRSEWTTLEGVKVGLRVWL